MDEQLDANSAPEAEDSFFANPSQMPEEPDFEEAYVPKPVGHHAARLGLMAAVGIALALTITALVYNGAKNPVADGPALPDLSAYSTMTRTADDTAEAVPAAEVAAEPVETAAEAVAPEMDKVAPAAVPDITTTVANDGKVAPLPEVSPKATRDPIKHAFALFNAGKFAAAEKAAMRATRSRPTRADGWLVLGAARDALGNHSGAISAYRTCGVRARGPAARDCHRLAQGL